MPVLDRNGTVFLLDLGDDENRWNPDWMRTMLGCLDEIEATEGPRALVTTASGRYWSTGLDLAWLAANPDATAELSNLFHTLLARMLTLAAPCVAAVSGHAFGAGAMLVLAHDFRVMSLDRGYWCLPESDIGMPFSDGTAALVQGKLAPGPAHRAMITANRYPAADALAEGIIDVAVPDSEVVPVALARAEPLAGKNGPNLGAIKRRMYAPVHQALLEDAVRYS